MSVTRYGPEARALKVFSVIAEYILRIRGNYTTL